MELLACLDIRSSKDLIAYKTYADLRAEAERTYLGVAWWLLEPLISMSIYYFVFNFLFSRGTDNFVAFLAVGVIVWQWFAGAVQQGSRAILGNVGLIRKVALNNIAFPLITILTSSVRFAISLIVLFAVLWLYGFGVDIYWMAFPVLVMVQFLLILSVTLPLSAIVPFFPDLNQLIGHVLRIMFFISGIFWAVPELSPKMQTLILLNPMALMVQSYRDILMYDQWPPVGPLLILTVLSLVGIYIGALFISRFNQIYAKRISQ